MKTRRSNVQQAASFCPMHRCSSIVLPSFCACFTSIMYRKSAFSAVWSRIIYVKTDIGRKPVQRRVHKRSTNRATTDQLVAVTHLFDSHPIRITDDDDVTLTAASRIPGENDAILHRLIHAPLAGCDVAQEIICRIHHNFNPRTPRGVRPLAACVSVMRSRFQSTHPSRGATVRPVVAGFQPKFQSTHPSRGATGLARRSQGGEGISIHAPLAGCDGRITSNCFVKARFQSTHPSRGATPVAAVSAQSDGISIHAPLAGCDIVQSMYPTDPYLFQSTHPSRGATRRRVPLSGLFAYFNPRTPRGVRRRSSARGGG